MAEMCNKVYQVILIGAGVSGLSAANFLVRHGIVDILVLEGNSFAYVSCLSNNEI